MKRLIIFAFAAILLASCECKKTAGTTALSDTVAIDVVYDSIPMRARLSTEVDGSVTNEIQTLTPNKRQVKTVKLPDLPKGVVVSVFNTTGVGPTTYHVGILTGSHIVETEVNFSTYNYLNEGDTIR